MIPRYSRPDMVAIWSPETRFRIWFEIEAHACDALAELGVIPKESAANIWEKGKRRDLRRRPHRRDRARVTKHDVIAFLTHLAEIVGPEARFVHQGMTSSDVLDTCFNVQLVRASDILLADIDALLAALKRRAFEHKDTVTIGRSHGIHAEPTTFGVKLAQAYAEFERCRARLVAAREEIATCAISGAVGTFANIDPRVEEHVAKASASRSSRSRPRSSRATAMPCSSRRSASSPPRSSGSPPRSATCSAPRCWRPRSISRPGQKGSSAMPHKRNPVLTENLTGLARMVRGMRAGAWRTWRSGTSATSRIPRSSA
jgi:adenylosuccinate lyase